MTLAALSVWQDIILGMSESDDLPTSSRRADTSHDLRIRGRRIVRVECARAAAWFADEKRLSEALEVLARRIRRPIEPTVTRVQEGVVVQARWTTSAGVEVQFTTHGHPPQRAEGSDAVVFRTTMTTTRTLADGTTRETTAETATQLRPVGQNTEVRHERVLVGDRGSYKRIQLRLLATYFVRRDLKRHARQCEAESVLQP